MNTQKRNNWTANRLANLGQSLMAGYSLGITRDKVTQEDTWTTDKFINMSCGFAQGYGFDMEK